ncbi:Fungal specific transcription factor domain [Nakaseomyces glabratus]
MEESRVHSDIKTSSSYEHSLFDINVVPVNPVPGRKRKVNDGHDDKSANGSEQTSGNPSRESSANVTSRPTKKRLACSNCRRRRKKCDLQYPCFTCDKLGLECNINEEDLRKKRYTNTYVKSLEDHIAHLEKCMRSLVEVYAPGRRDDILNAMKMGDLIPDISQVVRNTSPVPVKIEQQHKMSQTPTVGIFRDASSSVIAPSSEIKRPSSATPSTTSNGDKPSKTFVKGSIYSDSVNSKGKSNSQPNSSVSVASLLSNNSSPITNVESKERISDLKTTVIVRNKVYDGVEADTLPANPNIIKALSNFYKWLYPGHFVFVHRESFLYGFFVHANDNYKNSQYCSEELIYAMSAIGSRLSPEIMHLSESYYEKSKKALLDIVFDEKSVPRITTVQALFCLAFYELGKGNMQMAWYFSGLAIRVGYAMGFQLDPKVWHVDDDTDEKLTQSELEIRSRIYWGCYIADHFICLMLGRNSTLSVSNSTIPESDELPEIEGTEEFKFVGRHVLQVSLPLKNLIVLSRIVQVFTSKIFIESETLEEKLEFLKKFNTQVDYWKHSLPEFLQWTNDTLKDEDITTDPTISYFWYYYYIVQMTFIKPFIEQSEESCQLIESFLDQLEILLGNFEKKMGSFKKATLFQVYACLLASSSLKSILAVQTSSDEKKRFQLGKSVVQFKQQKKFFDDILQNHLSKVYELALATHEDQDIDQFSFETGPTLYPLNQVNNDVNYAHDFSLSNEIDDLIRDFFSIEQIDTMEPQLGVPSTRRASVIPSKTQVPEPEMVPSQGHHTESPQPRKLQLDQDQNGPPKRYLGSLFMHTKR